MIPIELQLLSITTIASRPTADGRLAAHRFDVLVFGVAPDQDVDGLALPAKPSAIDRAPAAAVATCPSRLGPGGCAVGAAEYGDIACSIRAPQNPLTFTRRS